MKSLAWVFAILLCMPLMAMAEDDDVVPIERDRWTVYYGDVQANTVVNGFIQTIRPEGQVYSSGWELKRGRLRYGWQGSGTVLLDMGGQGEYYGPPLQWNFTPGSWQMYISGGGGQGTYARFDIVFLGEGSVY